ncbi:MAG: oligopeptide transporter, OPT family, partial [Planctomycetota bacterium]
MTDANSTTHSTPTPLAEFTLKAVVAGVLLGCLFGAANAYLGLRVGLTVSASIPCAVMTVAVFKLLRARGTILEANMSQTIGSASTSLASGSIFTIPALFMWGVVPPYTQIVVLCFLGGVLGLCAMIPLRRLLIVQEHETLPYPEGKACADVLKATAASSAGSGWIFGGILVGALVKLALAVFFLVPKDLAYEFELLPKARLAIELAPALLAIGFILGIRQSGVLLSGGIVSALVLTPLIAWFGAKIPVAVAPETKKTIAEMTSGEIFRSYVRYVGAGAVATAGILTVLKSLPSMWGAVSGVLAGLRKRASTAGDERTDRDLPSWVIVLGIATVIFVAGFAPGVFAGNLALGPRLVLAAGVGVFGLLFVTVAARIVGIVGVSSQPTSGIALVTLIAIASVFAAQGWTDAGSKAAVLTVGTIVAVAASKAGDISQDLKTGYLLGATPARQQLGQLIGASVACWAVAGTVYLIGTSSGFGEGSEFGAPQATMMKTIVEGVLEGALPWDLVLTGAGLSIGALLCGVSALAFAIGVYLPLANLTPIFLG